MEKGYFITFEGSEGSGKSTQAELLYKYLTKIKHNRRVLLLREPGGVKISESVRKIILDNKNIAMSDECETLLYMAARAQLVAEQIGPALESGAIVLCDRFLDSTIAYQGFGNGVNIELIRKVGEFATRGIIPHLTFLFDIYIKEGLRRRGNSLDRIEKRSLKYHNQVRQGYLELAKQEPKRIKVIKANGSKEEIQEVVREYVRKLLKL